MNWLNWVKADVGCYWNAGDWSITSLEFTKRNGTTWRGYRLYHWRNNTQRLFKTMRGATRHAQRQEQA